MFSKDIIKSCIALYNKLKIDGIVGKKRIDYITNIDIKQDFETFFVL